MTRKEDAYFMMGKKATYEQRKFLADKGFDTYLWLVQKNCNEFMQVVNKDTGEVQKIPKEVD